MVCGRKTEDSLTSFHTGGNPSRPCKKSLDPKTVYRDFKKSSGMVKNKAGEGRVSRGKEGSATVSEQDVDLLVARSQITFKKWCGEF